MVFTELRVKDPRMQRWVWIMAHTRAGRGLMNFDDPFFRWLRDQILMVEDYALTYCSHLVDSVVKSVRSKKP